MFKITKDVGYDPEIDGQCGIRDQTGQYFIPKDSQWETKEERANLIKWFDKQIHVRFKILDGDGELYYYGVMTVEQSKSENVDEPLRWAEWNAGATTMYLWGEKIKGEPDWAEV